MKGEDVLAIAQTGTGKTAAFAIPLIDKIDSYKSSKRSFGIKCIVLVPTRELALQIGEVFKNFARHTKVKTFALWGGVEQDSQIKKLWTVSIPWCLMKPTICWTLDLSKTLNM